MREAYTLFKDGGDPEKVVLAEVPMCIYNLYSHSLFLSIFLYFLLSFLFWLQLVANFSSRSDGEVFYSSLYAGLYHESQVWDN